MSGCCTKVRDLSIGEIYEVVLDVGMLDLMEVCNTRTMLLGILKSKIHTWPYSTVTSDRKTCYSIPPGGPTLPRNSNTSRATNSTSRPCIAWQSFESALTLRKSQIISSAIYGEHTAPIIPHRPGIHPVSPLIRILSS